MFAETVRHEGRDQPRFAFERDATDPLASQETPA
jgi:hypothetical protein